MARFADKTFDVCSLYPASSPGLDVAANPCLRPLFRTVRRLAITTGEEDAFQSVEAWPSASRLLIVVGGYGVEGTGSVRLAEREGEENEGRRLVAATLATHVAAFVDRVRPASCVVVCAQAYGNAFARDVARAMPDDARATIRVTGLSEEQTYWCDTSDAQTGELLHVDLLAWLMQELIEDGDEDAGVAFRRSVAHVPHPELFYQVTRWAYDRREPERNTVRELQRFYEFLCPYAPGAPPIPLRITPEEEMRELGRALIPLLYPNEDPDATMHAMTHEQLTSWLRTRMMDDTDQAGQQAWNALFGGLPLTADDDDEEKVDTDVDF